MATQMNAELPTTVKHEHQPPSVAIKARIQTLLRPSPQNEYEEAIQLIKSKLGKMSSINVLFSVNLGTNHPVLIIDSRNGDAKISELPEEKIDDIVIIRPNDVRTFVDGLLEPRYAMNLGYFTVQGEKTVGIKFADALGPYNPTTIKLNPNQKFPQPTEDMDQAKKDLDDWGYALVKNAISQDEVKSLYARLKEQAVEEAEAGVAQFDGSSPGVDLGPNQRVWCIANKGQEFLDLLENPVIDEFLPILGNDVILFSYNAYTVREGNSPMLLHYDQNTVSPCPNSK
jgi:hypothetical protein